MKYKSLNIKSLLISLSLLTLTCGPIHEWPTEPDKKFLGTGTKARIVNTSFNSEPIDVYISGNKVFSYAKFKDATPLFSLNPGEHIIKIVRNSDQELLAQDTVKLDSNKIYTIEVNGRSYDFMINLLERVDQEVRGNYSLLRFVNSNTEIGLIDVSVFNQNDYFLIPEIKNSSASNFIKLNSGTAKINIYRSGTENLIFTSSAYFEAGKIYTIFFAGNLSATDSTMLNAYFLDETKEEAQALFSFEQGLTKIRFINGLNINPSIQILVDGTVVRNSLIYNQATSYLTFKAGVRNIRINPGPGQGFIDTSIVFNELEQSTLYITNSANNLGIIKLSNEGRSISGNRALIRIVNATQDLQTLQINIKSLLGQNYFEVQNYSLVSNYLETASGQNIITISSSGKPNLISISAFLEGGRVYTAFVSGSYRGTDKNALSISFVKDNDTLAQNLFTFEQAKSSIRLINGSPEIDGLDLIIDNNRVLNNLVYKYTSRYYQINSGFRDVAVGITGTTSNIFQSTMNLEYGKKYLLFALGNLSNVDVITIENSSATIPFGKTRLRFINGIYDLTAIDIKITNSSGTTNLNQSIFKNVTNHIDVSGGKNQIIVTQSGTQNVLITSEAQLDVGAAYIVLVCGLSNQSGDKSYSISFLKEDEDLAQKLLEFSPIKTNLRFINGIYDNPTVDLFVDTLKAASSINYKLATGLIQIPSGNGRNLKVTRSSSITQVYSRVVNIDYTKEYSFIVCGEVNFPDGFLIENPQKIAPAGKSSLRFVHGATGLGNLAITVENSSGTSSIPNVSFKSSSNYIDLVSGNNKITVTISSMSGNLILTADANLEEGKVYTVYILGSPSGSGESALDINFLIESNPGAQQLFKFAPIRSRLRFVNGSTDNPNLQLSIDNEFVATNVTYKLATAILNVNSGVNKTVQVFEFGSTTPLINQSLTLSHTKAYTFVVANRKNNLEYIFFESPQKTVPSGKVSVRVVHGAFDLSQIDITFNNYTSKTKISGLNYKNVSNYIDIPAGFNEIIVTKTSSPGQLILAIDATLEEGKIYTIYLFGNSSGNFGEEYSLNFLDETNLGGQFLFSYTPSLISRIRVINASPNSPGIDVTLDESKLAQNVLFGNSSGYLFTRSGLREVKVTPGGQNVPVLVSFNFQFETNRLYSFILMDSISRITPVLIEDLNFTPIEGKAYVRFINASSNSPPFDIKIGNPDGVIKHSYFTYQQITSYEPYDPQILSFIFTRTNSSEELVSLRGFSLVAGKAYTIIIMGFYQGATGQHLQVKWFQDN